jgi:hypothetical protein
MFKNINKSSGQIGKILLVLVIIVIIAIGIAYVVVKRAEKPPVQENPPPITAPELVYTATIGDIKFLFLEATDKGSILRGKDSRAPDWQQDLKTTERFIMVTIAAQNTGKENTLQKVWDVGEIIDNEGRIFPPITQGVNNWLPQEDLCGNILKPSFEPTSCKKIYEVAKVSQGLKVKVFTYKSGYGGEKGGEEMLDIKLMP